MMIRVLLPLALGAALAACQPAVPDSGRGVGFDGTLEDLQRQRDAQLEGRAIPAPSPVSGQPLESASAVAPGSPEETAAETRRILEATRSGGGSTALAANDGSEPLQASPSNPAPDLVDTAGISNENNFDAVSSQRSIEGDAARLAANRARYEVVQPQALPDRTDAGPNVVAFALQTSHPRGTQIYRRVGLNKASKFQRACAQFATADEAQIAFLSAGGPERDRSGMDPDGDGFACNWDPAPFRRAAQQG
jgi:hypothetical protein